MKNFPGAVTGFRIQEVHEGDHPWLTFGFEIYEFMHITFTYDRGSFGFSVEYGEYGLPLAGSRELGISIEDLDAIMLELDKRVRLRIPDKYLEWYEINRRRAR